MRRIKQITLFLFLGLLCSCSNNEIEPSASSNTSLDQVTKDSNTDQLIKNNGKSEDFLEIDLNEAPDIYTLKEIYGLDDLDFDTSRKIFLNLDESIVTVPIKSSQLSTDEDYPIVSMGIKIARKHPRKGFHKHKCLLCVECIGFICGDSAVRVEELGPIEANLILDLKAEETTKSDGRIQDFVVFLDPYEEVLKFHAPHKMAWNVLKAQEE